MPLPELLEYNQAIQDPRICFRDPELRGGRPRVDTFDQPQPCTGNFAAVYEMRLPGAKDAWAVKCFIREMGDLKDRYRAISEHLSRAKRSGFRFAVDFQFLDNGILVNGKWHPVLKMRWIEGTNLNQFVRDNAQRPALLSGLATLWLRMACELRAAKMAHGDLQHGNVLLVSGQKANTVHLRLIDYDGMFVPALAGKKSNEIGHRNYQHPQRVDDPYHGEIDRFSHLVIWTALHCVMSTGRTLWDRYDSGENLLFREEDFQSPGSSQLFQEAWKINEPTAHALVGRLVLASLGSARAVPLLHEIAPNGQPMALTADEDRRVEKLLTAGAKKGVRPPPAAAVVSRTHVARKPAPRAGIRPPVKASTWSGRSASPVAIRTAQSPLPAPAAQAAWPATAPPGQVHWKKRRRRRISLPLAAALVAAVTVVSLLAFIGTRAARSLSAMIASSRVNVPPPVVPGRPFSQPAPVAPQTPPNRPGDNSPAGGGPSAIPEPTADPKAGLETNWGGQLRFPAHHVDITFGVPGCGLFIVGEQVWGLETGKALQTLQPTWKGKWLRSMGLAVRALSSDGRWFAVATRFRNQKNTPVAVWSTVTGEQVLEVPGDPARYVDLVRFAGNDELWLAGREDDRIDVWRVDAAKLARTVTMLQPWDVAAHKLAIIPDGRSFACVQHGQIVACNAADGRQVAMMARPASFEGAVSPAAVPASRAAAPKGRDAQVLDMGAFNDSMKFLAFSPNGNELAAVSTYPVPQIVCWDKLGEIVFQEPLPFSLNPGQHSFEWLPDADGWLINGKLFDRQSKRLLVSIQITLRFGGDPAFHLLDQNRILGRFVEGATQLRVATIPWNALRASLMHMNSGSPALLSPARPVSVSVQIDSPRGDHNQSARQLTDALSATLLRAGIQTTEGQRTVFRLKLTETTSDPSPINPGLPPRNFRGGNDVVGSLLIEIVTADRPEPSWRHLLKTVRISSYPSEASNDKKVRENMIGQLVQQLSTLDIPYYIPALDEYLSLPLIIE